MHHVLFASEQWQKVPTENFQLRRMFLSTGKGYKAQMSHNNVTVMNPSSLSYFFIVNVHVSEKQDLSKGSQLNCNLFCSGKEELANVLKLDHIDLDIPCLHLAQVSATCKCRVSWLPYMRDRVYLLRAAVPAPAAVWYQSSD